MSFRRRIALASAAAVAIAVVLASLLVYAADLQPAAQPGRQPAAPRASTRASALFASAHDRPTARQRVSALSSSRPPQAGDVAERSCAKAARRAAALSAAPGTCSATAPDPDQVRGYQQVVDSGGTIARALGAAT